MSRITGQDVKITIVRDGEARSMHPPLVDLAVDVAPGDYFGASGEPLPWANLGKLEVTFKVDPEGAPAWNDFVQRIGERARADGRRALAAHIHAGGWIGKLIVHAGGIYLATVLRMEATPDPNMCVYRELRRASFDEGYDPDPEAQRRARGGAMPRPEWSFPTPTLDELVGQLERSEHPWVAMEVGKSGCVDTMCVPKGATP